jgi:hypothetical protein
VGRVAAETGETLIMDVARLLQQSTAVRTACRPDNVFYDILRSLQGNMQIVTCNRPRPPLNTVAFYFFLPYLVRFVFFVCHCPSASYRTACCGFFHYEKSDGYSTKQSLQCGGAFKK